MKIVLLKTNSKGQKVVADFIDITYYYYDIWWLN